MFKRKIGSVIENKAQAFLEAKGFIFVDKNVQLSHGEIDLIMTYDGYIVFIEVKGRRFSSGHSVFESLTTKKLKSLGAAINLWLLNNDKLDFDWRLDLVGVILYPRDKYVFEHIEFIEIC